MSSVHSMMKRLEALPLPKGAKRPASAVLVLANDVIRCELPKQASAMAYVTLLSLIPSLAAIFCVLSLFQPVMAKGMWIIEQARSLILDNLADASGEQVVEYLENMLKNLDLKALGGSALGSVLFTLILLLRQIEEALNRIWLIRKGRSTWTRFMYFWTFLTFGVVLLAVALGVTAGVNWSKWTSIGSNAAAVATGGNFGAWLSTATAWLTSFSFFLFLYKVVPNCPVNTKCAAWGAGVSSLLLHVSSSLYGTFIVSQKSYQTLYGALAQLPLFLTWLYICWVIILLGALVSWRLQEGFPAEEEEDTLDAVGDPVEQLRNVQVKAMMPWLMLLTIYRNFQQGLGRGMSAQEIAHAMHLPASWVVDALDALEQMGYILASKDQGASHAVTMMDPYMPAYPAHLLTLRRLQKDLNRPMAEWMLHWRHDLPLDIPQAVRILHANVVEGGREVTLADALEMMPNTESGASSNAGSQQVPAGR